LLPKICEAWGSIDSPEIADSICDENDGPFPWEFTIVGIVALRENRVGLQQQSLGGLEALFRQK